MLSNVGSLHYIAVFATTDPGEVHAGINRRVHGRYKTVPNTLCSRPGPGATVVSGIAGVELEAVTCGLCRVQLLDDSAIE